MHDYMKALHARFCREPELQKAREELEQAYREIKARLGQQDQEAHSRWWVDSVNLADEAKGAPLHGWAHFWSQSCRCANRSAFLPGLLTHANKTPSTPLSFCVMQV